MNGPHAGPFFLRIALRLTIPTCAPISWTSDAPEYMNDAAGHERPHSGGDADRLLVAAFGLIVHGPSSTLSGHRASRNRTFSERSWRECMDVARPLQVERQSLNQLVRAL
jgi:hypothetical protein